MDQYLQDAADWADAPAGNPTPVTLKERHSWTSI
jgi:hypothetical protein